MRDDERAPPVRFARFVRDPALFAF